MYNPYYATNNIVYMFFFSMGGLGFYILTILIIYLFSFPFFLIFLLIKLLYQKVKQSVDQLVVVQKFKLVRNKLNTKDEAGYFLFSLILCILGYLILIFLNARWAIFTLFYLMVLGYFLQSQTISDKRYAMLNIYALFTAYYCTQISESILAMNTQDALDNIINHSNQTFDFTVVFVWCLVILNLKQSIQKKYNIIIYILVATYLIIAINFIQDTLFTLSLVQESLRYIGLILGILLTIEKIVYCIIVKYKQPVDEQLVTTNNQEIQLAEIKK